MSLDLTEVFGLREFERHADGDADLMLLWACNRLLELERKLSHAVADHDEGKQAAISGYMRRTVEIVIGTPAETLVGMAAKATVIRVCVDHRDIVAESLASDALRLFEEGHGNRFNPLAVYRELREQGSSER